MKGRGFAGEKSGDSRGKRLDGHWIEMQTKMGSLFLLGWGRVAFLKGRRRRGRWDELLRTQKSDPGVQSGRS